MTTVTTVCQLIGSLSIHQQPPDTLPAPFPRLSIHSRNTPIKRCEAYAHSNYARVGSIFDLWHNIKTLLLDIFITYMWGQIYYLGTLPIFGIFFYLVILEFVCMKCQGKQHTSGVLGQKLLNLGTFSFQKTINRNYGRIQIQNSAGLESLCTHQRACCLALGELCQKSWNSLLQYMLFQC